MDEVLKIVIADDNEVLVDMMKKWIEENERYQVIGMARDRNDEMYLIDTLKPNVVITDIKEKDGWTGLDVVEKYMDSEYKPIFFIVSALLTGKRPKIFKNPNAPKITIQLQISIFLFIFTSLLHTANNNINKIVIANPVLE